MRHYSTLVVQIRDAVREKAQEIPIFKETGNGAIRILIRPLCREADRWIGNPYFGGLSDFGNPEKPDIVEYEHTFAITAGGSRLTIVFRFPGYGPCEGASFVGVRVQHKETNFDMPFCSIYIFVSGANQKDAQECSKAGVKVIHDFFRKGSIAGFGSPFVFLTTKMNE